MAVFGGSRGLLVILRCRGSFDDGACISRVVAGGGAFATRIVAGGDFLPAAISVWCFLLTDYI